MTMTGSSPTSRNHRSIAIAAFTRSSPTRTRTSKNVGLSAGVRLEKLIPEKKVGSSSQEETSSVAGGDFLLRDQLFIE